MKTLSDHGISDATIENMKRFFLKTSAPRIYEKRKKAGLNPLTGEPLKEEKAQ